MKRGVDAMYVIRQRANDTDKINYTDAEILENINSAIRYLSQILINKKSPEMISSETIVDYSAVPSGFCSFVGNPPAFREGDVIRTYTVTEAIETRFWQYRNAIASLTDHIPFPDEYFDALVTTALMITLLTDEFDVSAEQSMFDKITDLLP